MVDKYTPTTTHATWGAGNPHLIVSGDDLHHEVPLQREVTRIGSGADADVRLEGLDTLHAEIHHDDFDEYVLELHGAAQTSHRHEPIESIGGRPGEVLRHGARFVLGSWAFVFARDEFADHGIPFGGRAGGEGSREHHQHTRPDYTGSHPVITPEQLHQARVEREAEEARMQAAREELGD